MGSKALRGPSPYTHVQVELNDSFPHFSRIGRPQVRAPMAVTIPPTNPAFMGVVSLSPKKTPTAFPVLFAPRV